MSDEFNWYAGAWITELLVWKGMGFRYSTRQELSMAVSSGTPTARFEKNECEGRLRSWNTGRPGHGWYRRTRRNLLFLVPWEPSPEQLWQHSQDGPQQWWPTALDTRVGSSRYSPQCIHHILQGSLHKAPGSITNPVVWIAWNWGPLTIALKGTPEKEKGIFFYPAQFAEHMWPSLPPQADKAEDINYTKTQTHVMYNKKGLNCIMYIFLN